ncbi:MAG: acyl-CoA dehydrogenase family protein, partial [Deltaproteobacteria bacterium]|nr:acyl-CoA dehydrogenase family protein [Deltaproteobacteria bacterium]
MLHQKTVHSGKNRACCQSCIGSGRPRGEITDRRGEFNQDAAALFWDLGLLQIMLQEEYGGWPVSPCTTLCLCVEEIA